MDAFVLDVGPGRHISDACSEACKLATEKQQDVRFTFNDTSATVHPGDDPAAVEAKWMADMNAAREAWVNSAEYKERERLAAEEYRKKCEAVLVEPAKTEEEMREAKEPWPYTDKQLSEYVASLVDRPHDYGTACYAMSLAASAAFNYVAHKLGVTGFQSSCADLDFLRRNRHIKGPFMLIKGEDALYPQYDLHDRLNEAMENWRPWLKEEAGKLLVEKIGYDPHPDVKAHWQRLAS